METTTRNATLTDLRKVLEGQQARKLDVVASAGKFRAEEGMIRLTGIDPILDDDGVTDVNGLYRPTAVFDEGIADKLKVPLAYVRRLRDERPDLYDANVNGWLHGRKPKIEFTDNPSDPVYLGRYGREIRPAVPADDRSFMLRMFRGDDGGEGIARAFLSDRYSIVDNLDALMASLAGISKAGVAVKIKGCDLTERRMYVRVVCEEVRALAPVLLARYRSPFSGRTGADNPTVFAGFVISNSETGGGAFSITPQITVEVCDNGMTITKDAVRSVHLGGKQEESIVRWSDETLTKDLELITLRARDAVRTFLDVDYMTGVIRSLEEKAEKPISGNVAEQLKVVTKKLAFDEAQADAVFRMFVEGGDVTAGGVMHAVTAAAQVEPDADKAAEMEAAAIRALEFAYAL